MDTSDSEADDIDIDNMLDECLPDDLRERKKMHAYEEKTKSVLEGSIHFHNNLTSINQMQICYLFLCSYRKRKKSFRSVTRRMVASNT